MIRQRCLTLGGVILAACLTSADAPEARGQMILRFTADYSAYPPQVVEIIADNVAADVYIPALDDFTTLADLDETLGVIRPFDTDTPVGDFMVSAATTAYSLRTWDTPDIPIIQLYLLVTGSGSSDPATFVAELTDTDFWIPTPPMPLAWELWTTIGGVSTGTAHVAGAYDSANQLFGHSDRNTSSVLGPGEFGDLLRRGVADSPLFSLTVTTTVTAADLDLVAVNARDEIMLTPEPGSLAVWGVLATVGLGVAQVRRSRERRAGSRTQAG